MVFGMPAGDLENDIYDLSYFTGWLPYILTTADLYEVFAFV